MCDIVNVIVIVVKIKIIILIILELKLTTNKQTNYIQLPLIVLK